jgi:hypothetical protein
MGLRGTQLTGSIIYTLVSRAMMISTKNASFVISGMLIICVLSVVISFPKNTSVSDLDIF